MTSAVTARAPFLPAFVGFAATREVLVANFCTSSPVVMNSQRGLRRYAFEATVAVASP